MIRSTVGSAVVDSKLESLYLLTGEKFLYPLTRA